MPKKDKEKIVVDIPSTPAPPPPPKEEIPTGWVVRDFGDRKDVVVYLSRLNELGFAVKIEYLHKTRSGPYSAILFISKLP